MKSKILLFILSIIILTLVLVGCNNKKEEQTTEEDTYVSPVVSQNKDIFVYLPFDNTVAENYIRINGLTALNKLQVEVYDSSGNLLNENNTNVELTNTEEKNTWKVFNKYLYFNKKPATSSGYVKIFSDENNMVKVNVKFINRLKENESIKVIYPEENSVQKGKIRVYGYASVYEGIINYQIKDKNGKILSKGEIQVTTSKPDTGIFAKDISLETDSTEITLILTEKDNPEGSLVSVEIPIKYEK